MADVALEFLLKNLKNLLLHHHNLIKEIKNEVEKLEMALRLFRAFLGDSIHKRHEDVMLRELDHQIRDLVYAVEDTIDSFVTHEAKIRFGSNFMKSFRKPMGKIEILDIERKVEYIGELVNATYRDKKTLGCSPLTLGDGGHEKHEVPLIRYGNIVGFDDEAEKIIGYLKEESKELDVISIIGLPGLGKTTLARKIFQEKTIQCDFPTRIWVCVSQDFNLRDVLLQILKGITDVDMSDYTDQDLTQTVRAYLEGGQFLLVMDDVWSTQAWNAIRKVLPKGNREGKVLITSRHRDVAIHANLNRNPHHLRLLTENESWELFQYEVFGRLDCCPDDLKDIAKDIAKQCDGLPLATVLIGGILVYHLPKTQEMSLIHKAWHKVSENISTNVKAYDMEQRICKIIALSYDHLPDELKSCFLYLGVFPKGHEISTLTLTGMWIAEGFIRQKMEQSLEETAKENLNDLIKRNLCIIGKTNFNGEVKTCCVHDVVREFCVLEAAAYENNLFQEIELPTEGVFDPPVFERHKCRRLCTHFQLSSLFSVKRPKHLSIRSFLCFYKEQINLDPKRFSSFLRDLKLLRVLESKSFITGFPHPISKLFHLRYITLSCDDLKVIPRSITSLWNLQILLIDTKSRTLVAKADICKMIELRHLKTKAAIVLGETNRRVARSKNLQTLSRLSSECCHRNVIHQFRGIKTLGIRGCLADILNSDCLLHVLECLENLKMVNDLHHKSVHGLPPHYLFPSNLKRLTLSGTSLQWKHIDTLGMIDSLQFLKLKDNAFTGSSWETVVGGFRSLQFLLIATSDLVSWKASSTAFRSLRYLVFKNCDQLSEIPIGLAKSLQKLSMEWVPNSAVECAKKIKEEKEVMQGPNQLKLKIGPTYEW